MENRNLTRREFLRWAGILSTGALVAACAPAVSPTAMPTTGAASKSAASSVASVAPTTVPTAAVGSKKVTIRWATNYVGNHAMAGPTQTILKKFKEDFPNVTLEVEETPGNDHQTKIKLDASSDRVPDIFNYWRLDPAFGLDQIADANKLADLAEWTKSDAFFKDLFEDSAWRTASRNNKVYGIPTLMFYVQFIANKDVLDRAGVKAPSTYEELLAAVKTLKSKGELPWGIAAKGGGHAIRAYNYVFNRMFGNQRAMNMHAGKEPFSVPESVKAAQLIQELFIGNLAEDAVALDESAVVAKYINTGKAAFVIDGSWETANISKEIQDKMIVLEFPLVPGGAEKEKGIEKDLTNLWYVSAKGWNDLDKQPVIKELVKRLSSRDAGKLYAEVGQQPIPMRGTVVDATKVGKLAEASQKLAQERPGNKYIPTVMTPDVSAKFAPLVSEFFNGKYQPDKFVEEMAKVVKV